MSHGDGQMSSTLTMRRTLISSKRLMQSLTRLELPSSQRSQVNYYLRINLFTNFNLIWSPNVLNF